MSENGAYDSNDRELCGRILSGVAASAELQERFRKPLERFLVSKCGRGDGHSQGKAVEIASQILVDCFTKSPSLLEKWEGSDNLGAFLRTAAGNRLKTFWSSPEYTRRKEVAKPEGSGDGSDETTEGPEEIAVAEQALLAGVSCAVHECPEGLVFMRLKGLHGVGQREISRCWGHHESQTSRRITEAMDMIRKTADNEAGKRGIDLTFGDFGQALQRNPTVLLGDAGEMIDFGDDSSLRQLAAGGAGVAARRSAVALMCRNPRALEFFAQLLNRKNDEQVTVAQDPELSSMAARLGDWIRRSLEILHPAEARGLVSPLMADALADALRDVGADGGTLWLLRPGEAALEAVFNPLEPEILAKRQPLVSGIVSLVLATGETSCVTAAVNHGHHSPAIDIAMGKTTRSMIAVPFLPAGNSRGVLTAVRLDSDHPFSQREIGVIERQALLLAELFAVNLTKRITG